ncbi:MAG: hypothetical protein K2Q25_07980 [Mycobacteriaceae bacterium]|nr:hypothetical protein [Mycobacteriaceae bacterium]
MTMDDRDYLCRELALRIEARPLREWSSELLQALIAVFDVAGNYRPLTHNCPRPQGQPFQPYLVK